MSTEKKEQMRKIRDEVFSLTESPLYKERVKNKVFPVIGEGSHDASIMFVGEAPGRNEAATGRPFCGAAGKILDELLTSVNVPREGVYVTNIVKDRPPGNRDPLPSEIEIYAPFLVRQVEIIKPKVIATLGRFSMNYILEKFCPDEFGESISRAHGKEFKGETSYGEIIVLPLYHPAVAVYNNNMKETLKEDFKLLKKFV
jgi:uracil-DNA glycosylase